MGRHDRQRDLFELVPDAREVSPDARDELREARDRLPDVRDGLTRLERAILLVLDESQRERGGRNVPTAMLYGRVVERINVSQAEFMRALQRLMGRSAKLYTLYTALALE